MNMTLLTRTIFQIFLQLLLTLPPPKVTIITDAVQRYEVYSTFVEVLSVSGDLMAFFVIIDAYTDSLDVTLCREAVDIIVDAILNPNKARPTGELFIGTVTQQ